MWDKLWEAIQKYGGSARDARIGAVGADQIRDLYKSDKQEDKELAKELNDRYLLLDNYQKGREIIVELLSQFQLHWLIEPTHRLL